MRYFNNDYAEGCHQAVLDRLIATNFEQTLGYGEDEYCRSAADKIRNACGDDTLAVHFLVGGTQTNLTVISAALRPHQAVLCPVSGHIHVHETGAIEATGHKVVGLPCADGKITASQVRDAVRLHRADSAFEHIPQPKMVYISQPTEYGTLYSLAELEAISTACRELGLLLFLDGARMGYGLAAKDNDVFLPDLARLCDVFYIGGTKVGALFGEAVVISNPMLKEDFRYIMKQKGAMLAKGRLLGVQFDALFTDNLYETIAAHAISQADRIRSQLSRCGWPLFMPGVTNQVFAVMPDGVLEELGKEFSFSDWERVDEANRAVRFCTSWATKQEDVDDLCRELQRLSEKF